MTKNATLEKLPQWKITKVVPTRCQIIRQKCTKFDFRCGSAPETAEEVTALSQTSYLDLMGLTAKWIGEKSEGMEGEERMVEGGENGGKG